MLLNQETLKSLRDIAVGQALAVVKQSATMFTDRGAVAE
jgi:hypothetical protein